MDNKIDENTFLELGVTGLSRWGGTVNEEFLPELQGRKAIQVYREMSNNDPIIGAILFAIKMLCRQVVWRVELGGDTDEDKKAKDFLESCMNDMSTSWEDTISEILSMLTYGFSYHEIVYKLRLGDQDDSSKKSKYNDGLIGWRKLSIRSQETLYEWVFDTAGGIQGMKQIAPPDYRVCFIPIEKALLFRTEVTKGNPEGRSILRNAYRPWHMKKSIEDIEGIGIERDLAGLPVAWVPPEVSSPSTDEGRTALEKFKTLVTKVRRDQQEGIIMPLDYDERGNKRYDFTLLSSSGRQFDVDKVINRYNQQIAQTVLADFIMLGTEKVGSYALSSNKTHIFALAIGAFLDEIEGVLNTHAVPRLFKLNPFNVEEFPKIKHGEVESVDLTELGDFISKLASAGMPLFPNADLEEYLLKVANLPGANK
jgi:hypothetical protein